MAYVSFAPGRSLFPPSEPCEIVSHHKAQAPAKVLFFVYDERYEREYGYLRYNVANIIYHYLDCSILDNGFARVRCTNPECGHEYLLSFSCKSRCICISCHAKRSVIPAERIAEEVIMPVNHRHWVFTVPKVFRAYLKKTGN